MQTYLEERWQQPSPKWETLIAALPNVTHIRLHIDIGPNVRFKRAADLFDYRCFAGLIEMPKLRRLDLDICSCLSSAFDDIEMDWEDAVLRFRRILLRCFSLYAALLWPHSAIDIYATTRKFYKKAVVVEGKVIKDRIDVGFVRSHEECDDGEEGIGELSRSLARMLDDEVTSDGAFGKGT